jgi:predicted nucleic acid-binding protein
VTGKSPSVVDANVIIRFLVRDDETLYQRSEMIMTSILEGRQEAIITDIVIAECVYVLQRLYKVPRDEISKHLRAILSYPGVAKENHTVVAKAFNLYEHHNVSFVDAMCAALALERGGSLATFDTRLAKLVTKLSKAEL